MENGDSKFRKLRIFIVTLKHGISRKKFTIINIIRRGYRSGFRCYAIYWSWSNCWNFDWKNLINFKESITTWVIDNRYFLCEIRNQRHFGRILCERQISYNRLICSKVLVVKKFLINIVKEKF